MNRSAKIRIAKSADATGILEIYKPYLLENPITFEESIPDKTDFQNRICKILEDCPYLVCEIEGEIAGYAYASEHRDRSAYRWNREVSVYVSSKFQRKNIARALYIVLFSILKEQGFANLLAGITLPNLASVALHESFGFKKCAEYHDIGFKNNSWHSVGWWELFLVKGKDQVPDEPISFSSYRKENDIANIISKGEILLKI